MNVHSSTPHRILILGGGYGGLIGAARLGWRRIDAGITLVDAGPSFSQRIRMHELLAGKEPATVPYEPLLAKRGIRFQLGRATALDVDARTAIIHDPTGEEQRARYDQLVLALGSRTQVNVQGVTE